MKFVKIKEGPYRGKRGLIISKDEKEYTVKIEGEDKPQKVKINWVKVLGVIMTILEIIKLSLSKNK